MKQDDIHFIQFMHPGAEHRPGPDGKIGWNRGPHRRKFLQQSGRWLTGLGDQLPRRGDLHFWAEWEPQSELVRRLPSGDSNGPRFLFRPTFCHPDRLQGLQNTDPFVFGESFYYCVCQQRGVMKRLAAGSVILFGSCRKDAFVLDTVFVVQDWVTHDRRSYRTLDIPDVYRAAGLGPLHAGQSSCSPNPGALRLYRGATHGNPCHGMYSFFPCLPAAESSGFGRPAIRLPGVISDSLRQGLKAGKAVTLDRAMELWLSVVKQVREQKLRLGVFAELPSRGEADRSSRS